MISVLGFILMAGLLLAFIFTFPLVFENGLLDLFNFGYDIFGYLFGSTPTIIMTSLMVFGFATLVVRFIMSWLRENPGQPANK